MGCDLVKTASEPSSASNIGSSRRDRARSERIETSDRGKMLIYTEILRLENRDASLGGVGTRRVPRLHLDGETARVTARGMGLCTGWFYAKGGARPKSSSIQEGLGVSTLKHWIEYTERVG